MDIFRKCSCERTNMNIQSKDKKCLYEAPDMDVIHVAVEGGFGNSQGGTTLPEWEII